MFLHGVMKICRGSSKCYSSQGDQLATKECYLAMMALDEQVQMMSIEERRFVAEPTEVLEDIPPEKGNLEKFTRIGTSMKEKTK